MKTSSPLRLGFLALLTTAATAATAAAQTTWTGASGGSWDAPENWSSGAPILATNANLNTLASPYAVNFNTALGFDYIGLLTVGSGATLNVNAALSTRGGGSVIPLTVAAGGIINVNNGGALTIRKTASGAIGTSLSGTVTVSGGTLVTQTDGGTGKRFDVNSGGSFVLNSGTATFSDGGFRLNAGSALKVNGGTFSTTTTTVASSNLDWFGGASVTLSLGNDFIPLTIGGTLARQSNVGGGYTLSLIDAGATPGTTYTLTNFASTGFSLSDITLNTSIPGTLDLTPTSLTYTVAAVPEPSTVVLGVGLLSLAAGRLWKRRRLQNF